MRIALCSNEVAGLRGGGIGTYVTEAGTALQAAGHEVWLVTARPEHGDFSDTCLIGVQTGGVYLAERLRARLAEMGVTGYKYGKLDITFHRDDFRRRDEPLAPNSTEINFLVEGKRVILVDDVLYTGRTIRAGMDALLSFGRPESVELLVLVDRRFTRHLPISPTYVGKAVDSYDNQRVHVDLQPAKGKSKVLLYTTSDE